LVEHQKHREVIPKELGKGIPAETDTKLVAAFHDGAIGNHFAVHTRPVGLIPEQENSDSKEQENDSNKTVRESSKQ
jgi:hypothetical protein